MQESKNPAGRAAAASDGRHQLGENVEAVFVAAVSPRLHDAEKIGLPHARDHLLGNPALGLGL